MADQSQDYGQDHLKYLELIQFNIARMHNASVSMKRYAVTAFAVGAAMARYLVEPNIIWIIAIAVFAFWLLDAMYLSFERAFRTIYEDAAVNAANETSRLEAPPSFNLTPNQSGRWPSYGMKSWSTYLLYVPMLAILALLWLFFPTE